MILDLPNQAFAEFPHFKDGEGVFQAKMFFDGKVRIMNGLLVPGASIGMHTHTTNCEILFVLTGAGTVIEDGEEHPIVAGQCTYCEQGHAHSLINTGNTDLAFYAVVPEM